LTCINHADAILVQPRFCEIAILLMNLSRLQLRRLAAYLLVVWVLALGVSVAHACVLASRVAAADHAADVMDVRTALAHVVARAHGHEQPPVAKSVNCVKFCSEDKASAASLTTIAATAPALIASVPLPVVRPGMPAQSLLAGWFHDQIRHPPRRVLIELLRLVL
jgi:hypothetical protein